MNYKSLAWAGGLLLLGSIIGVAICGYKNAKAATTGGTATTTTASG